MPLLSGLRFRDSRRRSSYRADSSPEHTPPRGDAPPEESSAL